MNRRTIALIVIAVLLPLTAYGQSNSSLWILVGNALRPVVSTWKVISRGGFSGTTLTVSTLKNCTLIKTNADGTTSCGVGGGGGGGSISGSGAANQLTYYTGVNTISGASMTSWDNTSKLLSTRGTVSGSTVLGAGGTERLVNDSTYVVCPETGKCDYTDIQSAINALPSGGGKIFVRKGNYTVSSTIRIKQSGTVIEGEGSGTVLQCDGSSVNPCIGVNTTALQMTQLSNLHIRNSNASAVGVGLDLSDTPLSFVNNVRIERFATGMQLIDAADQSFYSKYDNVVLFDNKNCLTVGGTQANMNTFVNIRCRPLAGGGGTGVTIINASGLTFTGLDVEPSSRIGITGVDVDGTSNNITFLGGWIEGNDSGAVIDTGAQRVSFLGTNFSVNGKDTIDGGTSTLFMNNESGGSVINQFPSLALKSTQTNADSIAPAALDIEGPVIRLGDPLSPATFSNGIGIKFYDNGNNHGSIKFDPLANKIVFGPSTLGGNKLGIDAGKTTLSLDFNTLTASGVNLHADTGLSSSGALSFEETASGSSLYLGSALRGAGLSDCIGGQALEWTAATGRFSCFTPAGTTYTAGKSITLNGTAFELSNSFSGTLATLRPTDSTTVGLNVAGTMSGRQLWISGTGGTPLLKTKDQKLGINNASPAEALDVHGNILSDSIIYVKAAGTATIRALRGATSNFSSFILGTATTDEWAFQMRNDSTNDLYIQDTGNGRTDVKIIQSTGQVKFPFGASGTILKADTSLSTSGTLVFEGAATGSSLFLGTSLKGAGLTDCGGGNAVQWSSATGRFGCFTPAGSTYTAGQGLTLTSTSFKVNATLTGTTLRGWTTISGTTIRADSLSACTTIQSNSAGVLSCNSSAYITQSTADTRYLQLAGGTVTGNIKVRANLSGSSLNVDNLHSCTNIQSDANGALSCNSTAYETTSLTDDNTWVGSAGGTATATAIPSCSNGTSNALEYNTSTNAFSCVAITGTTYTAGQGLTLTSTSFKLNTTNSGSLSNYQTQSGSLVKANVTLSSSGTLVWEGPGSGSSLYLGASLAGAGLTSCNGTVQILQWSSATSRFGCANAIFQSAGQGLTLTNGVVKLNATLTGTTLRGWTTISGSVLHGDTSVSSSGALVWEGAGTGSSLYLGTSLKGAGLITCSSSVSVLQWNSATGRFGCGSFYAPITGGSSGQLLVSQGNTNPIWKPQKQFERFVLAGPTTTIAVGSGMTFPAAFSGVLTYAQLQTSGTSSGVTVNIYVNNQRVTSTPLSTDNREPSSETAATPMVLNATKSRFNKFMNLRFDVSSVGTPLSATGVSLLLFYDETSP